MGESKGTYYQDRELEAFEDMVDRGVADSTSDASRMVRSAGFQEYGYTISTNGDTQLKWLAGELARLFSYIGVGWIVFFWAFPVSFAMPGVALLFMALGMVATYALLDAKEPAVSKRLGIVEDKA